MSQPILVFDLDGTLVDSAPDLLDSLNYTIEQIGLSAIAQQDLHALVGMGARVMIERALTLHGQALEEQRIEMLLDIFIEHYYNTMPGKTHYFAHVSHALDQFQQQGYLLAVCTNKLESLARHLLETMNEAHRFAAICGGDTFAWRKPDPRHILSTIKSAGGVPDKAVMIGDSYADITAAQAAHIPVIAVDFGYSDKPVETFNPDRIISSYDALTPELIATLLK